MKEPPLSLAAEAFLFASVVPALVFGLISQELAVGIVTFLFAFFHMIFLAIPLYLFCRWRGWVHPISATLGGCCISALPISIYDWPGSEPTPSWDLYLDSVLLFAVSGAVCGFIFWLYLQIRFHFYLRKRFRRK